MVPGGEYRESGALNSINDIDLRHETLIAELADLSPKLAAIRLVQHVQALPSLASSPQTLFYHADSIRRLGGLVLDPNPLTSHVQFLKEIRSLIESYADTEAAKDAANLDSALRRISLILAAELATRHDWDELSALGLLPDSSAVAVRDLDGVLNELIGLSGGADIRFPFHFGHDITDVSKESVLTVLVDGEEIPERYREAYIAALSTQIRLKKKQPGSPVVRSRDHKGDDLPLGDELKELVREAVQRSLTILGPSAQARARNLQIEIDFLLSRPSVVIEIHGRSILLPLILAISRQLGEQFNLSAALHAGPNTVWTGDVDDHGNVCSVSSMAEKSSRVSSSSFDQFVFPVGNSDEVERVVGDELRDNELTLLPVTHMQDLMTEFPAIAIRGRSFATRALFDLRQKTKPLGFAGAVIIIFLLIALGFAVPRLSSWLDTNVAEARQGEDRASIELLNSRNRTIRSFLVPRSGPCFPVLNDLEEGGEPEILYATQVHDSIPSTLFCFDIQGQCCPR